MFSHNKNTADWPMAHWQWDRLRSFESRFCEYSGRRKQQLGAKVFMGMNFVVIRQFI